MRPPERREKERFRRRDRHPDLVDTGEVDVWLMNGAAVVSGAFVNQAPPEWQIVK